ncbi:MAG: cobalt-factor II C(20)-methyltransferase [Paraclostridium sp.]
MAKFYGIGTGPGDSDLVTVKAVKTLGNLEILYTPEAKREGNSLALSIVEQYLPDNLEIKQRHFPMNFNDSQKILAWNKVADEIVEDVREGKNVGFVTLGDPMIYSTYVYIMERLIDKIDVETIPGISSFSNIASNQNFPLVMDKEPLIILPCTIDEEKIDHALENYSSIVLMKVYKNFKEIVEKLEKNGLIDNSILVSNSSLDDEVVYEDLRKVGLEDKISYFSTILVNKENKVG